MSTGQIILYVVIALVLLSYLRRFINNKRIKHYESGEISKKLKMNSILLLDVRTEPERKKDTLKVRFIFL